MVDLPVCRKIPAAIAHSPAQERPFAVKRQTRDLTWRHPDWPVGARAGVARTAAAPADVPFAHIAGWAIGGVILAAAHRAFVNVKSDIECFSYLGQCAGPEIHGVLDEACARPVDRNGIHDFAGVE